MSIFKKKEEVVEKRIIITLKEDVVPSDRAVDEAMVQRQVVVDVKGIPPDTAYRLLDIAKDAMNKNVSQPRIELVDCKPDKKTKNDDMNYLG
jgi:hypothetical protein